MNILILKHYFRVKGWSPYTNIQKCAIASKLAYHILYICTCLDRILYCTRLRTI